MNLIGLLIQFLVFVSVIALVFLTDFAESTGKFTHRLQPAIPSQHHHQMKPKMKTDSKVSDVTWDLSGFFMDKSKGVTTTILRGDAWHQHDLQGGLSEYNL